MNQEKSYRRMRSSRRTGKKVRQEKKLSRSLRIQHGGNGFENKHTRQVANKAPLAGVVMTTNQRSANFKIHSHVSIQPIQRCYLTLILVKQNDLGEGLTFSSNKTKHSWSVKKIVYF